MPAVQLKPFVKCVMRPLWPSTERLKCYGAKNSGGVFNQYQQLLSSLKSANELTASDFSFHFIAVVFKASSLLAMVAKVQQTAFLFSEAGGRAKSCQDQDANRFKRRFKVLSLPPCLRISSKHG